MNQRAFNLFTALVAFVLIMLTILLVQSMLSSEDTVISTIARLESQSKLYAVAHITRADALQIFNYFVRYYIEDWITESGGTYLMDDPTVLRNWDDLQKEYAITYFGGGINKGDSFAWKLARNLRSYFRATTSFGNYTMKLEDRDVDMSYFQNPNNADPLKEVIGTTMDESALAGEFFEVIGCENGDPDNCDLGTFYITFAGSKITDEDYEQAPVLKIVDNSTNEFVKIGIIPRHDLRIYVPLRLFKALAIARDAALNYNELNNLSQNNGLLSPRVHNEIEEMKLGFCDKGYCAPRTNPYMPPDAKEWENKCNGTSEVTMDNGGTYTSATKNIQLAELVKARVCEITALNDALNADYGDFIILESDSPAICGMPSKLSDLTVQVNPKASKQIHNTGNLLKDVPNPAIGSYNSGICPISQNNGFDNPNAALFGTAENTEYYTAASASCSSSVTTGVEYAECAEVTGVVAELVFVEENPKYKVVNDPSNVVKFTVEIQDNRYRTFDPTLKPVGLNSSTCLFGSVKSHGCSYDNDDWKCYQQGFEPSPAPGAAGGAAAAIQCSPKTE
ncbi:MAG: hypothetical protein V1672_03325 [Candidatus Diapherotrites archaeon]